MRQCAPVHVALCITDNECHVQREHSSAGMAEPLTDMQGMHRGRESCSSIAGVAAAAGAARKGDPWVRRRKVPFHMVHCKIKGKPG